MYRQIGIPYQLRWTRDYAYNGCPLRSKQNSVEGEFSASKNWNISTKRLKHERVVTAVEKHGIDFVLLSEIKKVAKKLKVWINICTYTLELIKKNVKKEEYRYLYYKKQLSSNWSAVNVWFIKVNPNPKGYKIILIDTSRSNEDVRPKEKPKKWRDIGWHYF